MIPGILIVCQLSLEPEKPGAPRGVIFYITAKQAGAPSFARFAKGGK
jgi:hypothetical protein